VNIAVVHRSEAGKGFAKWQWTFVERSLYVFLICIKYNTACKELYDRLKAKGKRGKVALIAVCNKLIKQAFAIATRGTIYQKDYKSSLN
jgi:hypothetical protein